MKYSAIDCLPSIRAIAEALEVLIRESEVAGDQGIDSEILADMARGISILTQHDDYETNKPNELLKAI